MNMAPVLLRIKLLAYAYHLASEFTPTPKVFFLPRSEDNNLYTIPCFILFCPVNTRVHRRHTGGQGV